MRYLLVSILLLYCFTSCQNAESGRATELESNRIYYDYQVSAEEGHEEATVRLQYKIGDENGRAFVVEKPGKVMFDGAELKVDSTHFTGAYYELIKPLSEISGEHTIAFVDKKGKEHTTNFSFAPFSLAQDVPERVKRKPFTIQLKNFPASFILIRLVMTDTSLQSPGVNEEMQIENGRVAIDEAFLNNLKAGPVTLEIYREEERPVGSGTKEAGRLLMTFGIRRQFELVP